MALERISGRRQQDGHTRAIGKTKGNSRYGKKGNFTLHHGRPRLYREQL